MDLRSFKLRLVEKHVRAVVAEATGERGVDFEGAAFERIAASSDALIAALQQRWGVAVRALSVDLVGRALRASVIGGADGPGRVIEGPNFEPLREAIWLLVRAIAVELRPSRPAPDASPSSVAFWSRLYQDGGDGWELARAAPPLARWFAANSPSGKRALVVGCGRGHEARMLAGLGALVTGVDFAEPALVEARRLAEADRLSIDFRQRDLFELPRDPERYDLIVEHTCFCAIDPDRRGAYVNAMADLLTDGGELVGLFWNHGRPLGPPFSVSLDEVRALFAPRFDLVHAETAIDSVALRDRQETLARFRRR